MSKDQLTEHYKKILDFICLCEGVEELRAFYKNLDEFFQTEFEASPLLIYSLSTTVKSDKQYCRGFWNRGKEKLYYTDEEIEYFKDKIQNDKDLKENWKSYKISNSHFYIILCGENETQKLYGVFKTDNALNEAIITYLQSFLNTSTSKYNQSHEVVKLKTLVNIDDVTSLFNQRKFRTDIDELVVRHQKHGETFTVIFIDIDHFKQVNDGHGHLVGTNLLKQVGEIIKDTVREHDICYRYGGDEFVVVIPDSDVNFVKIVGERILNNISKDKLSIKEGEGIDGDHEFSLTVSVGIANFPADAKTRDEVISMADKMMYKAKESGRGRVCLAGEKN